MVKNENYLSGNLFTDFVFIFRSLFSAFALRRMGYTISK